MAEHRSYCRQLPATASGKTRQREGSGSCGGGLGGTTSPSLLLPPAPSAPRCHGNTAPRRLAPPFPPAPSSLILSGGVLGLPLPVPSHLLRKGGRTQGTPRTTGRGGRGVWKGGARTEGRAETRRAVPL